jgi:hypothetical protein
MGKLAKRLEIAFLLSSSAATLLIMFHASGWNFGFESFISAAFYLWAVLPYIIFFVVSFFVRREAASRMANWSTCITSLLLLVITLLVYIDAMFIHVSSTSCLVFIFLPLYLLIGITIFRLTSFAIAKKTLARK